MSARNVVRKQNAIHEKVHCQKINPGIGPMPFCCGNSSSKYGVH
jgi:hypothetical protein